MYHILKRHLSGSTHLAAMLLTTTRSKSSQLLGFAFYVLHDFWADIWNNFIKINGHMPTILAPRMPNFIEISQCIRLCRQVPRSAVDQLAMFSSLVLRAESGCRERATRVGLNWVTWSNCCTVVLGVPGPPDLRAFTAEPQVGQQQPPGTCSPLSAPSPLDVVENGVCFCGSTRLIHTAFK